MGIVILTILIRVIVPRWCERMRLYTDLRDKRQTLSLSVEDPRSLPTNRQETRAAMEKSNGFLWLVLEFGGLPTIRGSFWGGPCNEDCSILGSILGSPYSGKLPHLELAVSQRQGLCPLCDDEGLKML